MRLVEKTGGVCRVKDYAEGLFLYQDELYQVLNKGLNKYGERKLKIIRCETGRPVKFCPDRTVLPVKFEA